MANLITDPANSDYDFGQDFNYAVWSAGSSVSLTNVPWNNDYRDVVKFPMADGTTLDEWIDENETAPIVVPNVSYLKFNVPVRLNIPFNKAFKFNYLRVQNPVQPIPGSDVLKSYYYFILDVKYIAPNTTEFTIQLDIFQSFNGDYTLGNSYIERGHIGIANENSFDNYGRDWLTIPEGLDVGGEYRVIARKYEQIMKTTMYDPDNFHIARINCNVLVVSTTNLLADPGDVDNPVLVTANGSRFENLGSGATYYMWNTVGNFTAWMSAHASKPWMTQGIISITIVPKLSRYQAGVEDVGSDFFPTEVVNYRPGILKHFKFNDWRESSDILNNIEERYRHLEKFLTYPYMIIEMTTWTGTPIVLKPESWADDDATIIERATFTAPNQRVEIYPLRYNAQPNSIIDNLGHLSNADAANYVGDGELIVHGNWIGAGDDGGEYLDLVTKIVNFPTMAIVNNGAISYLASNANGIAYQSSSADWSQQRALRGNETSYDQTVQAIQASKNINSLQNMGVSAQTANQNLLLAQQQAVGGIGSVLTTAASAGVGGADASAGLGKIVSAVGAGVVGGIQMANQQAANDRSANSSIAVSKGSNAAQNNQTGYVNDTNKSLADWSARGDYENSIAGINAKVQDAKMIQPTTSGQIGGETINMVYGNVEVSLRWKLVDNAAIRRIGEYWLRYGYAVRVFGNIPASLMVMTKFTYWKLQETYISSSAMPEGFKQIIRGIFEKGVTVWADPSDIGNIDLADNDIIPGIVL